MNFLNIDNQESISAKNMANIAIVALSLGFTFSLINQTFDNQVDNFKLSCQIIGIICYIGALIGATISLFCPKPRGTFRAFITLIIAIPIVITNTFIVNRYLKNLHKKPAAKLETLKPKSVNSSTADNHFVHSVKFDRSELSSN